MTAFWSNPIKKKQYLLLMGDILIVFLSFIFAYAFRIVVYEHGNIVSIGERISWLVVPAVVVHILSFYTLELYTLEKSKPDSQLLLLVAISVLAAAGLIAIVSYLLPDNKLGRILVGVHIPLLIIVIYLWRKLFFVVFLKAESGKNLVFFDDDQTGEKINILLKRHSGSEYYLSDVITDYDQKTGSITTGQANKSQNFEGFLKGRDIRTIVLSEGFQTSPDLKKQLLNLKYRGIEIYDFPTFYGKLAGKIPVSQTSDGWLLLSRQDVPFHPAIYQNTKRFVDICIASIGLVISLPVLIFITLSIILTSKGPIFFRQERLGIDEKPFTLIKFRTMISNAEKATGPLWSNKNDPRITYVGRFLRKTRLDEIPQLINVLKGDMSFVGPRPIRRYFADKLAELFPFYRLRFVVKPGITGWAQVNSGYAGSEDGQLDKLEYELFYIRNQSFFLDMYIVLKTIQTVLFRRGE